MSLVHDNIMAVHSLSNVTAKTNPISPSVPSTSSSPSSSPPIHVAIDHEEVSPSLKHHISCQTPHSPHNDTSPPSLHDKRWRKYSVNSPYPFHQNHKLRSFQSLEIGGINVPSSALYARKLSTLSSTSVMRIPDSILEVPIDPADISLDYVPRDQHSPSLGQNLYHKPYSEDHLLSDQAPPPYPYAISRTSRCDSLSKPRTAHPSRFSRIGGSLRRSANFLKNHLQSPSPVTIAPTSPRVTFSKDVSSDNNNKSPSIDEFISFLSVTDDSGIESRRDVIIQYNVKDGSPKRNSMNLKDGMASAPSSENLEEDVYNGTSVGPMNSKQSTSSFLKEQFFSFFQPSDNKLAMKLFGNKNALLKEKRRQMQHGKWVIHPCSSFRFYWDIVMLMLLISNLIILPVTISFFNDDHGIHWIIFNCFSDTIFLIDIAVNFRTGVMTNDFADEIILNPKEIARHYIRTWFFLDLISSIPMDYIFLILKEGNNYAQMVNTGRTLRIFRLVKLLSMLRLLRLSRLVRYVSQWEEFLNVASKFMGIFNLVLLMLLLGHWNACLQFFIPLMQNFPEDSWVSKCRLKEADWFHQYTWALFKAMSHMLSIGYGRFPPTMISEAWVTIVSMMTGATCYALFVGHAAALIQSFDTSKRLYREKFKQVEEYMGYRKLPRALRQRIASYYEHRYQGKMFNENEILAELSECLREQIINYNCRALVAAVPFFTFADQDFVSEVVTQLKFEVFQPGDLIIREGTIGNKMYFIQEGIVDIVVRNGEVATSLSDGSYFGEICLLTNAKRVASVRAETYCNLYSLDRESFIRVLNNYPLMRRTMESVAAERLSKIGQNPCIVSSREDLKEDLNLVKEIVSSVSPLVSDDEDEDGQDGGGNRGGPSQVNFEESVRPSKQQNDASGTGKNRHAGFSLPFFLVSSPSHASNSIREAEKPLKKVVPKLSLKRLGMTKSKSHNFMRPVKSNETAINSADHPQEKDEEDAEGEESELMAQSRQTSCNSTANIHKQHNLPSWSSGSDIKEYETSLC